VFFFKKQKLEKGIMKKKSRVKGMILGMKKKDTYVMKDLS
jgi:hypothetical protein